MQFRHVAVLHHGPVTVVAIRKAALVEINEFNHPSPVATELLAEVGQAVAAASGGIVLDMRDTESLDHASVAFLVRLAKLLADCNQPWTICCSDGVKEILDLCRLGDICPVVSALDVAVTKVAQRQTGGSVM
jgi:anti-anti-sigma regulatory factor